MFICSRSPFFEPDTWQQKAEIQGDDHRFQNWIVPPAQMTLKPVYSVLKNYELQWFSSSANHSSIKINSQCQHCFFQKWTITPMIRSKAASWGVSLDSQIQSLAKLVLYPSSCRREGSIITFSHQMASVQKPDNHTTIHWHNIKPYHDSSVNIYLKTITWVNLCSEILVRGSCNGFWFK